MEGNAKSFLIIDLCSRSRVRFSANNKSVPQMEIPICVYVTNLLSSSSINPGPPMRSWKGKG